MLHRGILIVFMFIRFLFFCQDKIVFIRQEGLQNNLGICAFYDGPVADNRAVKSKHIFIYEIGKRTFVRVVTISRDALAGTFRNKLHYEMGGDGRGVGARLF